MSCLRWIRDQMVEKLKAYILMEDSYCSLVEFLCRNYWIRRGNFTQDTEFGLRLCNLPVGEPSFVHASNIHLLFCTKFKLNSSFSALPPLLHSLCFFCSSVRGRANQNYGTNHNTNLWHQLLLPWWKCPCHFWLHALLSIHSSRSRIISCHSPSFNFTLQFPPNSNWLILYWNRVRLSAWYSTLSTPYSVA